MKPAYRLAGLKGRRYTFQPSRNKVVVRRVEMFKVVYTRRLPKLRARNLWRWLWHLGYRP